MRLITSTIKEKCISELENWKSLHSFPYTYSGKV
jgi:hypothetical protein